MPEKKLEDLIAGLGLDPTEIFKLLEPVVAKSIASTLHEMKLPDLIATTIDEKVKERTDALGAEVKTALDALRDRLQPAQPGGEQQQIHPLAQTVLSALLQRSGGGDSDDKFFDRMFRMQELSARMYQNPLAQAASMLSTMMRTAYSMGLEPQQVMKGLEEIGKPPQAESPPKP